MKVREGDLVETRDGVIFDVKGLVHPPDRAIAFIRYFPNKKGQRTRNRVTYDKVYSLSDRYSILRENLPSYLVYDSVFDETLCEVPTSDIKRHYRPTEKIEELRDSKDLDPVACIALRFARLLKQESGISWRSIGISGSVLADVQTPDSDVDPIIYGSENCRRVYSTLKSLIHKENSVRAYTTEELKRLFDFRSKDTTITFRDFVRTESRKIMQGKFDGTDYFVRFVKDWGEITEDYGDTMYRNFGYAKVEATVADDSEAIFTPCTYAIENVNIIEGQRSEPIEEVSSFRGRFCDQAHKGEKIVAQGKVERVTDSSGKLEHFRLLVGNKPSDYLVLENSGASLSAL
jgi:predicted nucleotidyltransferase